MVLIRYDPPWCECIFASMSWLWLLGILLEEKKRFNQKSLPKRLQYDCKKLFDDNKRNHSCCPNNNHNIIK